jgi:hypothetical protein
MGDILKVKEPVELACGAPSLMMGESLMNTSKGFDSVLYREPVGVFGCIVPFNFRDDSLWLDGAPLHRDRQHHGGQGGQHDPHDQHDAG